MPAVLTAFWNGHKKVKKNKKLGNLRIVSSYVAKFLGKITNFLYGNYFKKVFSETSYHVWRSMAFKPNDQSYWPRSWHSFFKWSHIVHKGAYWNGKQCCLRKFSFSLDEKNIFHFSSARKEVFLWRNYQIIVAKLDQIIF